MSERKIQEVGNGSFSVCLPKNWVINHVGKEKVIDIEEFGDSLVISTIGQEENDKPIKVNAKNKNKCLQRLVAGYLNGYQNFEVEGIEGSKSKSFLKSEVRKLFSGIIILDESKDKLSLKSFIHPFKISLNSTLSRLIFLVSEQLADTKNLMETNDKKIIENITEREIEIDRFYLFGVRQLSRASENAIGLKKLGINSQKNCIWYSSTLKSLEKISDHIEIISDNYSKLNPKLRKKLEKEFIHIIKVFELSSQALLEKDSKKADIVLEKSRNLLKDKESFSTEPFFEYHTDRVLEYCADLAEIVFEISENE